MNYISEQDIVRINAYVIEKYSPGEQKGINSYKELDSARNRPKQSLFGKDAYPTLFTKCATLCHSLIKNHPFYNANKRTALWSLIYMLRINGYKLTASEETVEEMILFIAQRDDKTINLQEHIQFISEWIERHTEKQIRS
ncbi:type II toxin-antitoxin system death-on-curing family toxin [Oceanobacillus sp. J11TS1]|uniref:type II toxin-antitoxin system death-on-curing family toxin n=1 Tax=Oceanobacillus sp. J11TS1 TaxID=2807191 RepID=UPI001B16A89A|nr:type II toxin-antitoxin system death-on-curing family toxin [Oceanobacillus sp. J11TS1]GIO23774.1 death-on-curing protein [Oceanobacillus sp. J11TS1]